MSGVAVVVLVIVYVVFLLVTNLFFSAVVVLNPVCSLYVTSKRQITHSSFFSLSQHDDDYTGQPAQYRRMMRLSGSRFFLFHKFFQMSHCTTLSSTRHYHQGEFKVSIDMALEQVFLSCKFCPCHTFLWKLCSHPNDSSRLICQS